MKPLSVTVLSVLMVVAVNCCEQQRGTTKSLDQRIHESEMVIAGYTRAVFKNSDDYKAEFLVFNTYKGEERFSQLLRERELSSLESALSRRLVNVSGFVCEGNVRVGETYILFLTVVNRAANYAGGQLVVYSREREEAVQEILGGIGSWGEWSSCTKNCGSGVQERKRNCNGHSNRQRCSPEDGQERKCNTFPCTGLFDVLDIVGLKLRGIKAPNRSSAFQMLANHTWQSESLASLHRSFPLEFGLLLTVRASTLGFVLRIYVLNKLQFGLFLGENNVSLIISDDAHAHFNHSFSLRHMWHSLAFSFRRKTITFFHNCKPVKSLPIESRLRPISAKSVSIVVGGFENDTQRAFEGDIEQLVISEAPSSAAEQCSPSVQPLMHLDSPADDEEGTTKKNSKTDRKEAFRGDLLFPEDEYDNNGSDDETEDDFAFGEHGSGLHAVDKVIPLISEDEEHYADDDEDEEDSKMSYDDWDELLDDEIRENDNVENVEGSGSQSLELLQWSEWSPCTHTCGWGTRSRTSYCANNAIDTDSCIQTTSNQRQTETCFISLCPVPVSLTTSTVKPAVTSVFLASAVLTTKPPCSLQCKNGGVCQPQSKTCQCLPGYYGRLCEYAICKPSCQNRGVCVMPSKCHCKSGYSGKACQRGEPKELFAVKVARMEAAALLPINVHVLLAIRGKNVKHHVVIPHATMEGIV